MDIPILLHTHSEYSFLWKATIPLLQRYAAGFTIYWITDSMGDYVLPDSWNLRLYDPSLPWSLRMQPVLKEVSDDYVIYLQEDWLLIDNLSRERLQFLTQFMKNRSCEFLMSFPSPTDDFFYSEANPSYFTEMDGMVFHRRPHHYMQPALWKKTLLEELCSVPLKIYEYERRWSLSVTGSKLCLGVIDKRYPAYHSTKSPLFPHMHAICFGKWTFRKYPCLKVLLETFGIDTSTREIEDTWILHTQ